MGLSGRSRATNEIVLMRLTAGEAGVHRPPQNCVVNGPNILRFTRLGPEAAKLRRAIDSVQTQSYDLPILLILGLINTRVAPRRSHLEIPG